MKKQITFLILILAAIVIAQFVYAHDKRPVVVKPIVVPSAVPFAGNVALTFDDGPFATSTATILKILRDERIKATFFLLGRNIERFPDAARDIVAEGHTIGNHSYGHSHDLMELSAPAFKAELDHANSVFKKYLDLEPLFFRPPFGRINDRMRAVLSLSGYIPVMWTIDPRDWDDASSTEATVIEKIAAKLKPGAIILFHDRDFLKPGQTEDLTLRVLPEVIREIRARGYEFVTIDELYKHKAYRTKQ